MIETNVAAVFNRLAQQMRDVGQKQVQFAAANAINEVAFKVKKETGPAEMDRAFVNPTPWAKRSLFVKKANKRNLRAVVGLGDQLYSKSRLTPAELLGHQIRGGARREKGLEMYLRGRGWIGRGEFIVPGAAARLDGYGNMSRGQVMQVISQLKLGLDRNQDKSDSKRSKRSVKRAGRIFWSRGSGTGRDHLPRGAWIDRGDEEGVRPLLVVIKSTRYKARFDLKTVVQQTADRYFEPAFRVAIQRAMATAKA